MMTMKKKKQKERIKGISNCCMMHIKIQWIEQPERENKIYIFTQSNLVLIFCLFILNSFRYQFSFRCFCWVHRYVRMVRRRNVVVLLKFKIEANSKDILAMKSNTQFTHTQNTEAVRLLSVEFYHNIHTHIQYKSENGRERWRSFTL